MTQGNRKKGNPVSGLWEHHRFTVCRNESRALVWGLWRSYPLEKWLVVILFFHPLIRYLLKYVTGYFSLKYFGEEGGGENVSLRFSTDAIVLLTNWVREGLYCCCLAPTPSGIGAAFPWKSIYPQWSGKAQQPSAALVHIQSSQQNFRRAWLGQMLKLSFQIL